MEISNKIIQDKIQEAFPNHPLLWTEEDCLTVVIPSAILKEMVLFMKNDDVLQFNFLTDLCCVHYPHNPIETRFMMVYHLHNWIDNKRVRIKAYLSENDLKIDSLVDVFKAANWMERESYDFFGVKFTGHPNLKRILNDEHMTVFPMRKEYPLEDAYRTDKDDRFFGRSKYNKQINNVE